MYIVLLNHKNLKFNIFSFFINTDNFQILSENSVLLLALQLNPAANSLIDELSIFFLINFTYTNYSFYILVLVLMLVEFVYSLRGLIEIESHFLNFQEKFNL